MPTGAGELMSRSRTYWRSPPSQELQQVHGGLSHHQSFVHEELLPRGAIIVLSVDGKAEEEDVHHDLKDGQEAVSHQEGEETHNDQRQ